MDKVALCTDLMWAAVITFFVFAVVSVEVGVSVTVAIADAVGCLGLRTSTVAASLGHGLSACTLWYDSTAHPCNLHLFRRVW